MARNALLWTALFITLTYAVSVSQPLQSIEIDHPPSLNRSSQSLTGSLGATIKIRCDAHQFDIGLNMRDCKEAFQTIARDGKQISFGQRKTVGDYDFRLPYRFSSGGVLFYACSYHFPVLHLITDQQITIAVSLNLA